MLNYSERTVFEKYYKEELSPFVNVVISKEVLKDGVVISSEVSEIHINESNELGNAWDEHSICALKTLVRRSDLE